MDASEKLDTIVAMTTDIRLAVATLAGEVRSVGEQVNRHDTVNTDVEDRLRALERRLYAVPSVAALIGLAGLAVSIYTLAR